MFVDILDVVVKSEEIIGQNKNPTEDLFVLKDYKRKESGLITVNNDKSRDNDLQPNESNGRKLQTVESLNEEFKYSVVEEARNSGFTISSSLLPTILFSIYYLFN